ncbi:hypothetical protein ACU4GH_15470 [Bradyrhizobium betae]
MKAVTALTMLGAATAWAGYNVWTGEYTFTREELQAAVEKRFPATLRYGRVIDVQLTHPRLVFDGANNRVTTQMDAQLGNTLLPAPPINGTLSLSSALKYDPAKRAVLLDNPSVERVQVSGHAGAIRGATGTRSAPWWRSSCYAITRFTPSRRSNCASPAKMWSQAPLPCCPMASRSRSIRVKRNTYCVFASIAPAIAVQEMLYPRTHSARNHTD